MPSKAATKQIFAGPNRTKVGLKLTFPDATGEVSLLSQSN